MHGCLELMQFICQRINIDDMNSATLTMKFHLDSIKVFTACRFREIPDVETYF